MSILIKGMEMPSSCFECKLLDYADTYKCRVRFESLAKEHGINISRPNWCPLAPVPPHGRLIDADELLDDCIFSDEWFKRGMYAFIGDAPTIIEAEEGET